MIRCGCVITGKHPTNNTRNPKPSHHTLINPPQTVQDSIYEPFAAKSTPTTTKISNPLKTQ
jgi:hypothetical protein